jgi:hypothetical protein
VCAALDRQGGSARELEEADDYLVGKAVPGLHQVRETDLLCDLIN